MTQATRLGIALHKIATKTHVLRVRQEDVRRLELRGATTPEMRDRIEATIARLERINDELERAL